MTNTTTQRRQRLTHVWESTGWSTSGKPECAADMLACTMATIEDGLLESGAVAGIDYTWRDLLQAAMPIIQRAYAEDKTAITVSWPCPPFEEYRRHEQKSHSNAKSD